jgi:acetylornithine aminotransferase
MANARERGDQLAAGLRPLIADGLLVDIRGRGLMLGLETAEPIARVAVATARDQHGLLINATGDTTLRLVPPLTIDAGEIDLAIERLGAALSDARGAA